MTLAVEQKVSYNFRSWPATLLDVAARAKSDVDVLEITGVAATCDIVNGEIFTPEVLERDGKSLIGKPVTDNHSEYPTRLKIKDIIGKVTEVWYDKSRNALMFKAEIWDEQAMRVLEGNLVKTFSVGYKWKYHLREDGIQMSDEISFDHLGYLNNPGDERAVIETMKRRENPVELEGMDIPVELKTIREMKRMHGLLDMGYEFSKRNNDKWGNINNEDIIKNNARVISDMMKSGVPITIRSELDKQTIEFMRTEKLDIITDLIDDVTNINGIVGEYGDREVKKIGEQWCVVHAHAQKEGSKTDKPPGTPIKCYSISKYGEKGAVKKAQAMHYAIVMSQKRDDSPDSQKKEENTTEMRANVKGGQTMTDEPKTGDKKEETEKREVTQPPAKEEPKQEKREEKQTAENKAVSSDDKGESSTKRSEKTDVKKEDSEAKSDEETKNKDAEKSASNETERASKKSPQEEEITKLREELSKRETDLKSREAELVKIKEAEKSRTITERVEGLLNDKSFVPADREKLKTLVSGMDDNAFKSFRELLKGRAAFSTEEKGESQESAERKKKDTQDKGKTDDPYHQVIT